MHKGLEWIIKIKGREYYMDSCLENFMLLLRAALYNTYAYGLSTGTAFSCGSATVVDTGGTSRASVGAYWSTNYYNWNTTSPPIAGNDNYGILVGSDDTAVDIQDYSLNTKIAHGTGAGQLQYGAETYDYGGSDPNKYAKILRTFTNGSGNDVTVKEVGLAVYPRTNSTSYYVLITRDILPSPVTIVDGDNMPVEIYLRTTA
jgi:hypothetical protein